MARRGSWPAVGLSLAALLAPGAASAQGCPTPGGPGPWPDWVVRPAPSTPGPATLAFEQYAFRLTGDDAERRGVRTDGVVIVHGGTIVYERYGRGFGPHNRHIGWSVSKSVTEAILGVAVGRGDLALDDSVCSYLPAVDADRCDITVSDIAHLATGFDWTEAYEGSAYETSSVLAMLYGVGAADMAAFVLEHPRRAEPGRSFVYSTGDLNVLGAVLGAAVDPGLADVFPWVYLFDPIGAPDVTFERDRAGTFLGGSYVYATPRDFARLGLLYLRDGCWDSTRVLPADWVAAATRVNPAFRREHPYWDGGPVPGRLWWLNTTVPGILSELPWPDVPGDAFAALGHWGQSVVVIPSLDLVVVRTADDRDDTFDMNTFLRLAIAAAQERS